MRKRRTEAAAPACEVGKKEGGFWDAWRACQLIYTAAMLLLLSPLLLMIFEPKWDAVDFFLPSFTYLADAVREMRFPLWDPYTNCGYPFHADPQNYTLNPLALIFSLLFDSTWLAFACFWVFHWWWGGLGMIRLSKHFGSTAQGSLVAAFCYALSGFFLAHAEHTSYIMVAGWLPWIFLSADRAVERESWAWALLAGAFLGLSSHGGYPVLVLFTCLALALWLAARFLPRPPAATAPELPRRAARIAATLAIVSVILLLIWSPVLHGFLVEGGGYTDRVNALSFDESNYGSPFTFTSAITIFFPFAGFTGYQLMGVDISMVNAYMGMLTLPLALYWAHRVGVRRCWWLFAFVVFMFLVSLGGKYGLRTLLYHAFPPMQYMRFSAPFRLFWIFPLCLAAGLGLSAFLKDPDRRRPLLWILLAWSGCAAAVAAVLGSLSATQGLPFMEYFARLFLPAIVVLAFGLVLAWWLARRPEPKASRVGAYLLVVVLVADMGVHLLNASGTVWGEPGAAPAMQRYHQRSTQLAASPPARVAGKPFGSTNAQQALKKPLVQGYLTMLSQDFDKVLAPSRFAEVLSAPYRFWLSPGAQVPASREEALKVLAETGAGGAVPAFVEEPVPGLAPAAGVPGATGVVLVKSFAPERVELSVEVPSGPGALLASTERHAAGWQVLVDGAPQPVRRVNLFFRGVFLPAGNHSVLWLYRPQYWQPLVAVSFTALLFSLAVGVRGAMAKRRKETAA